MEMAVPATQQFMQLNSQNAQIRGQMENLANDRQDIMNNSSLSDAQKQAQLQMLDAKQSELQKSLEQNVDDRNKFFRDTAIDLTIGSLSEMIEIPALGKTKFEMETGMPKSLGGSQRVTMEMGNSEVFSEVVGSVSQDSLKNYLDGKHPLDGMNLQYLAKTTLDSALASASESMGESAGSKIKDNMVAAQRQRVCHSGSHPWAAD